MTVLERAEPSVDLSVEHPDVRAFLDKTVRTWLGVPDDVAVDVPALPQDLAHLLLRTEEYEQRHRDRFGRWEYAYSANFRRGCLWTPEVDEWVCAQRQRLAPQVRLEPLWPNGYPFAVCLTHDVDMVSRSSTAGQALRALRAASRRHPTEQNGPAQQLFRAAFSAARSLHFGISRTPSTAETVDRMAAVEREFGVTASYFFTVDPPRATPVDCVYRPADRCRFRGKATTIRELVRELHAEGFDIGLHGSYNTAFDADLLRLEKEMLEDALGADVRTTRQHYLHFDVAATPSVQEEAGLTADTTLGFNRNVGFRAGTCLPFHLFDLRARRPVDVIEVPLIVEEFPLLRPNALELDRTLAERVVEQLIGRVAAVGGVATLLFHPHSLASDDYLALYRRSIEYALEAGAWVTSLREIERWWRDRERTLAAVRSDRTVETR
jgi:peptidoglycan/xylan/chitin deacetylase (PgdA/CDA1 family)